MSSLIDDCQQEEVKVVEEEEETELESERARVTRQSHQQCPKASECGGGGRKCREVRKIIKKILRKIILRAKKSILSGIIDAYQWSNNKFNK